MTDPTYVRGVVGNEAMFTAIRVLFNLIGVNITNSTIRMALIGAALLVLLIGGFYFRHEWQAYIAGKVYAVELSHNQAVNDAQMAILKDQLADQAAAISKLNADQATVKSTTDRLTNNLVLGKFPATPVGPATQSVVDGLRGIWPTGGAPVTPIVSTAPHGAILPSISAWLNRETIINEKH